MNKAVSDESEKHLVSQYSGIAYGSDCLQGFMREVLATMRGRVGFGPQDSLLDVGCGRGYFLRFLQEQGQRDLRGLEPCEGLASNALVDCITPGSFEQNAFEDASFDVVHTCHTLHHIPNSYPVHAIREMLRISRNCIVIVEINNTNIPMYFRSLLLKKVEVNAHRYNRRRVLSMLAECGATVLYSGDMKSSYISGASPLHKVMHHLGTKPYNITIARK